MTIATIAIHALVFALILVQAPPEGHATDSEVRALQAAFPEARVDVQPSVTGQGPPVVLLIWDSPHEGGGAAAASSGEPEEVAATFLKTVGAQVGFRNPSARNFRRTPDTEAAMRSEGNIRRFEFAEYVGEARVSGSNASVTVVEGRVQVLLVRTPTLPPSLQDAPPKPVLSKEQALKAYKQHFGNYVWAKRNPGVLDFLVIDLVFDAEGNRLVWETE